MMFVTFVMPALTMVPAIVIIPMTATFPDVTSSRGEESDCAG